MTTAHRKAPAASSSEPWLPLLCALTEREPSWCVWKNAERAVDGLGDVDSAAPRQAWPVVIDEYRRWAATVGAAPVIVCTHAPGTLVAVACGGRDRRGLLQLDVQERVARGVSAEALLSVARLDERGFRTLRPGAEGLLLLLALSRRPARRPRDREVLAHVEALVRSDPDGVEPAARLLGVGRSAASAAARSAGNGRWSYGAMSVLELVYALHALRHPRARLGWMRFRIGSGHRCPVLAALANDRRVDGDVDSWLAEVARNHTIF